MKIIVGLGNPGKRFQKTRHNLGFILVDFIAAHVGLTVEKNKFQSLIGTGLIAGEKVLLAKPQTFMNMSGQAVRSLKDYYDVDTSEILVVYDDMDFPFGTARFRARGSAGGHKGIQSILHHLNTDAFSRLRYGIGSADPLDPADYVLSTLCSNEQKMLLEQKDILCTMIQEWVSEGASLVMNRYNRKEDKEESC